MIRTRHSEQHTTKLMDNLPGSLPDLYDKVSRLPRRRSTMEEVDELDARLLLLLTDDPRLGGLECARQLGVARGTVQARLDRLERRGVLRGFPPDLDLAAMGYALTGFVVLEIAQ